MFGYENGSHVLTHKFGWLNERYVGTRQEVQLFYRIEHVWQGVWQLTHLVWLTSNTLSTGQVVTHWNN